MMEPGNKDLEMSNRRRWPRLKPDAVPGLKHVEFTHGADVNIIDISKGGLLLETEARLRPDMKIMLKLVTAEGVLRIDGTILRSAIYSLKSVPRYRTAIVFQQPLELLEIPDREARPGAGGSDPSSDLERDGVEDEDAKVPAVLTVVAQDGGGVCLEESFSLNNW